MAVRSSRDVLSLFFAWIMPLSFMAAMIWGLAVGVVYLELYSSGTEFFLSDDVNLSVRDMTPSASGGSSAIQTSGVDPALIAQANELGIDVGSLS